MATLVERNSRFVMLVAAAQRSRRRRRRRRARCQDHRTPRTAPSFADLGPRQRDGRPRPVHHRTGVPVYFCDPRSPWQRGTNENTNGLLRQYFPKRTEIAHYTQADLDAVAAELNGRPRQTLGWRSPSEALDEALR